MMNSTYTNHGDAALTCRPARWTDVVVFFLGNYAAHAVTVIPSPGQSPMALCLTVLGAILFPTSGIFRGFRAIQSLAVFGRTSLQTAARSGALYYLQLGKLGSNQDASHRWNGIGDHSRYLIKVSGRFWVPLNASLVKVPLWATFDRDNPPDEQNAEIKVETVFLKKSMLLRFLQWWWTPSSESGEDIQIARPAVVSCNYNVVKIIVSLVQAVYAVMTLYQTRGDQISRYGYAAFGLTVTPYAIMSIVNLLGNLARPDYATVHVVESEDMSKLCATFRQPEERSSSSLVLHNARENVYIEGTVGKLSHDTEQRLLRGDLSAPFPLGPGGRRLRRTWFAFVVQILTMGPLQGVVAIALPLIIMNSLTGFSTGGSSYAQRSWVMTWLVWGIVFGYLKDNYVYGKFQDAAHVGRHGAAAPFLSLLLLVCGIPAIGGFAVVAQMILEYGVCVRV
ncbi:hypothetical protein B0T17DRAFT_222286 [Bombardia bombarda]|uniref:Uncharacterized protein n=1 Tax=Bombardia bombarda TaxID=252184 RepID=A0AA39XC23_9PEZI|nr:hypothetical protein B0T17DRAFT_222286 [Bombardia bombarda]